MRITDTAAEGLFLRAKAEGKDCVDPVSEEVGQIFVVMRESIYRYLLTCTGKPSDAEDFTQEVFLRLYTALSGKQEIANMRAWLFRVAHNLVIDWKRQGGHAKPEALENLEAADPAPSNEEKMLADERLSRIEASLSRLSPQERQCLELRVEGLRYREIAQVLSISNSTVQTFLSRAVKKLGERR